MTEHDLSEVYLRDGSQHVRLRRGATVAAAPVAVAAVPAVAPPPTPASAPPAGNPAPAAAKKNLVEIKSETVGTFYSQPKPGEPAFVKIGDRVTPTKVVGLVEVMKTYNEIQANCTGVIVEALVENGKYVEFGQVLYRVEPS
ncbi:MAG: acetyl-CoA carboxylase, biotin carboxyl carrier protein [Planctomycetes bacterium]|nr:acetyl-CoA carboxylase, biotin carboxyl carrier protein [Planctomycetota bacterium]